MKFVAKGPQTGSIPEETGITLTLHLITDIPVCNKRQIKGGRDRAHPGDPIDSDSG